MFGKLNVKREKSTKNHHISMIIIGF